MRFGITITAMKLWSYLTLALAIALFIMKSSDAMSVIYLSFAAISGKTALDTINTVKNKGDK